MSKKIDLHSEFESAIGVFNPTREGRREFRIMTQSGALDVQLYDDKNGAWIAAIWDDVKKAAAYLDAKTFSAGRRLNHFSGKWNWHWSEQTPDWKGCRKAERVVAGRKMIVAFVDEVGSLV
jgi:hypothetical protein